MRKKRSSRVRIGLVQMSCNGKPDQNLQEAVSRIQFAAGKGAQIVCLQELFRTLYFCKSQEARYFDWAETIPGPTTRALSKLAKSLGVVLIAPLFEKRAKGIYHNTAVVLDADGALAGKYRKMHIPDDPGFYEKFYFVPGDLGFGAFKTRYAKIGVLICWDQWFPEAARLATLSGAEILFYPTAIGWKKNSPDQAAEYQKPWQTIQCAHAIANGVWVACVNRVGTEGIFRYWGQSFVADPFGNIVSKAGAVKEEVLIADCNLKAVEKIRREWPFLRDRRIDAYSGLTSRSLGW